MLPGRTDSQCPLQNYREVLVKVDTLSGMVSVVNSFLWDFALLILLCGTGIYFTLRLKFIQIRKFPAAMKSVFGKMSLKGAKAGKDGMSSFQSLATAVAAQVGTGNVAGAATAILAGGPGAIFWMWLSAFFGMATIYGEATLAQKYKTQADGHVTGGPVYYIRAAFQGTFGKALAALFSVLIILALGFMGNMVQSNSIGAAFQTAFGIEPWIIGIVVAIAAGFIFIGGVSRIASVTEKIVPIMALLYVIGALIVIIMDIGQLGEAFRAIFVGAFAPGAILGGAVGITIKEAIRFGVARGLFSNEAGMGSTPHAHAMAKVEHPCDQGLVAMVGVFIDTFVVLTMTALVIIISGANRVEGLEGVQLAQSAFSSCFGAFGNYFIAICLLFFAFSTIIGWYFFGEQNIKYLFGAKNSKAAVKIYAALVVVFVVVGSCLKVGLVWDMSDMFNGLMVIPNLLGLLALSGVVVKLSHEHEARMKNKK